MGGPYPRERLVWRSETGDFCGDQRTPATRDYLFSAGEFKISKSIPALPLIGKALTMYQLIWEYWAQGAKTGYGWDIGKYNAYESQRQAAMVNSGLLRFVAHLGAVITLVVAMYRIYLKASPGSKPIHARLILFGLYFLVGSNRLPSPIVDHPTLSMRAALCLAKATGA